MNTDAKPPEPEATDANVRNTVKEIPEAIVNTSRNTAIPLTFSARLGLRGFPQKFVDLPKAPPEWLDVLHSETTIHIDWLDRIRILFTGRAILRSKTVTQFVIGDHIQACEFSVLPWRFFGRKAK
jgi:hypothetical protein